MAGSWDGGDPYVPNVAEVWDPATGAFSPAGSAAQRRDNASSTLLPDGRVLIVGGCIGAECERGPVAE